MNLALYTQGGYGSWPVSQMDKLVNGQPGVTGWSTFGFTQVPIDNQEVPALGLTRHLGSVQPPTTSGHPITGPAQIELGAVTLRALGKHVGDTIIAGAGRYRRRLTIVGTVTLPSMGLTLADHVSLGRGAMLADSTLLAIEGLANVPAGEQVVPGLALLAGFAGLLVAGNLLTAVPASVAARTRPAAVLWAE